MNTIEQQIDQLMAKVASGALDEAAAERQYNQLMNRGDKQPSVAQGLKVLIE